MSAWELYPDVSREILSSSRSTMGPPEPPAFAGIMSAIGRAFPVAYNEALSAITGVATEYGRAAAITYGAKPSESIELMGSPAPIADQYRAQAKRLTPDPMTTGAASRFIFDATRVLTKAAASAAVGGVPGAIAGTGVLEGTVESQKLRDEGVDAFTAAKAGAIRGISTAAGLALPVAGRTLLETAGLVVAGGPVSYMAEQAAARAVLEHADYSKIAERYDPFDPMGLALSVAVPGAFGAAVHLARGVKAGRAARALETPAVTEEEVAAARTVQLTGHVDETRLHDPGDAQGAESHVEALNVARAQIDAGERVEVGDRIPATDVGPAGAAKRAELERRILERDRASDEGDIVLDPDATFRAGTPAREMPTVQVMERARQIVGEGRFKELADRAVADLRNFLEITAPGKALTDLDIAAEIEHVARQVVDQKHAVALQPELAALLENPDIRAEIIGMRGEAGWAETGGRLIRDPGTGEVSGRTAWIPTAEWWPGRPDGLSERQVRRAVDRAIAGDKLTAAEGRTLQYMAEYAAHRLKNEGFEPAPAELEVIGLRDPGDAFDGAMVARAAAIDEARVERLALEHENNDAAFMRAIKDLLDESDNETTRGGESGARAEASRAESGGGERDHIAEAARSVVDEAPDLRVIDELTGEEVTAAELWRRAEETFQIDAREAEAYPAAVTCFLRAGA